MADWNLRETWEAAYKMRGGRPEKQDSILATGEGFGEILSYLDGRKFAVQLSDDGQPGLSHFRFTLNKLGVVPAFTPSTDVLVVGCGFGWLVEVMLNAGSNSAWGTDTSAIIHQEIVNPAMNVPASVRARVLNIDITSPTARQQFQAAGAGNAQGRFRWVVTEFVIDTLETAEIAPLLNACDNLRAPGQGGVAHLVVAQDALPPGATDPALIPQRLTLAQFVALRPAHWWVDSLTQTVGGGQ